MLKDYFEVPNKPAIKSGNILSCDFTDHETFIPQPLDYSRGTLATYVDCNGLIKMSGVSDTELVTNGDFATDSDWNKGTGWIINDGKAINTGGANFSDLTQNNTNVTIGKTYKITYTISDYTSGSIKFIMNNNSAAGVERNANGTYTDYISALSQGYSFRTQGSGFIGKIDNVSVKQVDVETPRIDYLTEIGKAKELQKPSLLLEPQSTNLVTFSEDFSGYTTNNSSISSNVISSPDGSLSASKLIENTATAEHTIQKQVSVTSGNAYSISVFVKKDEISSVQFGFTGSNFASPTRSIFDIENGIITTNVSNTASIQNYGNGWYKLKVTNTTNATGTAMLILQTIKSGQANYTGDGVSGFYMWGLQWEQQAYCTSYIPTSGSTVTRNQDLANNAGQLGVFNDTEGVLYLEIAFNNETTNSIAISDGGNNNRVTFSSSGTINRYKYQLRVANVAQCNFHLLAIDNTQDFNKYAVTYKPNYFSVWCNGVRTGQDTSGITFPSGTLNTFLFARGNQNSDRFYGRIRQVKAYRRFLTDAELQELTNNIV
jgi:hypothetical protein